MQPENYVPIAGEFEVYKGRIIRVYTQETQIAGGKKIAFEYAERSPGVRVLVFAEDSILLTKEWRLELQREDTRLPGGKVFDSLSCYVESKNNSKSLKIEQAKKAAQKELLEETGLAVPIEMFDFISLSACGATVVWDLYYFCVKLSERTNLQKHITTDEGESIKSEWCSYSQAMELFTSGGFGEDRSSSVLVKQLLNMKKIEIR